MSIRPASAGFSPFDPERGVEDGVVDADGADGCPVDAVGLEDAPQAEISRAETTTASSPAGGARCGERLMAPSSWPLITKV
jgi:hypothetical protein